MRTYVAKSKHKRPCDMCGERVEIGDEIASWAYVGDEGPSNSNILRCHKTCHDLWKQHDCNPEEFLLGRCFKLDVWKTTEEQSVDGPLAEPARVALAAARAKTPLGAARELAKLVRAALPHLMQAFRECSCVETWQGPGKEPAPFDPSCEHHHLAAIHEAFTVVQAALTP